MTSPRRTPLLAAAAGVALLASASPAFAQSQNLAFTGGVLLNTKIGFSNLGGHPAATTPGPATGGAVNRTYDNGFNRVDDGGNAGDTTSNWGYNTSSQLRGTQLVLSSASASSGPAVEDVADFIAPSAGLEYRGSLGTLGNSDWGLLLGIGYQRLDADTDGSFVTDAVVTEDAYGLGGLDPAAFPPAPYSGSADTASSGPRIGSVPSRSLQLLPGGRVLTGSWEVEADVLPIVGGLYLETQIAGRLNGIASAGLLAAFINADLKFNERSVIAGGNTVETRGGDGTNDFIIGGFVQLGLDWALWENASLVAAARWQPSQVFEHSVSGRTVEIDFTTAFAVHAGVSFRF